MLTIDEAINHCEEVAEEQEQIAIYTPIEMLSSDVDIEKCQECASEHRQLAEWLKELKDYRERMPSYEAGYNDAKREIALSGEYERAYQRGYMKAMEYCTKKLKDVNKQTEVTADDGDSN